MTNRPRIIVFAYHEVGFRCLEWLLDQGETVVAVFTHDDSPQERIWFRSVANLAAARGIPVLRPPSLREEAVQNQIQAWRPDLVYSFYYRNLIPATILGVPTLGAFNIHGSLLPRYRGRVPVNWAIIQGERETGATLHYMVPRADAGDIVDQEVVPIGAQDTAHDVFLNVTEAAVRVLARSHGAICERQAARRPQDESCATTFGARTPEDGRIHWDRPAASIFNLVRALTEPYPGAFSETRGERFFVWWGEAVALPGETRHAPGTVVSTQPLVIASGDGGFWIKRMAWATPGSSARHSLGVGDFVGP